MGLNECRECKNQVSEQARNCPKCGAPKPWQKDFKGTGIDWKSQATLLGYPLIHIAAGRDAKGRLRVAKGIIAIGQFGIGLITIAQFGVGILFGFGQFIFGFTAIAQFAGAIYFGLGQLATGHIAIGQLVLGNYGFGQTGYAKYLWSVKSKDPQAIGFFKLLWYNFQEFLGKS